MAETNVEMLKTKCFLSDYPRKSIYLSIYLYTNAHTHIYIYIYTCMYIDR